MTMYLVKLFSLKTYPLLLGANIFLYVENDFSTSNKEIGMHISYKRNRSGILIVVLSIYYDLTYFR